MQYVVGVDVGTSGCKSIVIDDVGKVVAKATEEYPLSTPKPGWSEQELKRRRSRLLHVPGTPSEKKSQMD